MRLTISLDEDLYRYVKARSKNDDVSMSAVINEIVRRTKEPNVEPIAAPFVRNGILIYPAREDAPAIDLVELKKQDEEEEDLRHLRALGLVK